MPDEKKVDAFKPAAPSIPGVPLDSAAVVGRTSANYVSSSQREAASRRIILAATACAVVFIAVFAFIVLRRSSSSRASASTASAPVPNALAAVPSTKPAEGLPVGPGLVATVDELAKPWAAKKFLFRDPITAESVPAMVVALPGKDYWAFSLREPFGNCDLAYVTNLATLHSDYNFHAEHPMVVDTCNRTVYDLSRYGSASDGGLVRGEIVQGSGIRPPMAIEVRVEGKKIMAVRME